MNARESLAADAIAEVEYGHLRSVIASGEIADEIIAAALASIAAELRAARVYANYREGRDTSRTSEKRSASQASDILGGRS